MWAALKAERPLQIVGAINAYTAMLAEQAGFRALYVSGAGVAVADHGVPDLGITTINDVVEATYRVCGASELPVLVDVDTGFGHVHSVQRLVRSLERAGAAALHIEDQVAAKRCGHRPGKAIVDQEEMVHRVRAVADARSDESFMIIARTDAVALEGIDAAVERACAYRDAGADAIFAEAVTSGEDYRRFVEGTGLPVLANVTEGGVTPIYDVEELTDYGVSMALYPLSAFRAMSAAAIRVYDAIRKDGSQENVLDMMQPRAELYERLGYHEYEETLDAVIARDR